MKLNDKPILLTIILLFLGSSIGAQNNGGPTAASGRPKLSPAQWREDLQFALDAFAKVGRELGLI